jgi:hypothetical protein
VAATQKTRTLISTETSLGFLAEILTAACPPQILQIKRNIEGPVFNFGE